MILDFTQCDDSSSAGLRGVLVGVKKFKGLNKTLVRTGMNKVVREVFRVSGFDRILTIEDDIATALGKHGSGALRARVAPLIGT